MTLELLKAGLRKLIDDGQHADEAKQAIAEIEQVQQLAAPDDIFKGECFILHTATVSGLLNIATYDAYGKLFVEYNGDVSLGDYEQAVREAYECNLMPTSAIELGYDIIRDLYSDNEALECHKQDGTFKHLKDEENETHITAAVNYLQAYHDCNREVMNANDTDHLLATIKSLKAML